MKDRGYLLFIVYALIFDLIVVEWFAETQQEETKGERQMKNG